MSARSFSGTLGFAAVAAGGVAAMSALLGAGADVSAHIALVVAVAYGVALARSPRDAWRAGWLGGALAGIVALAALPPGGVVAGAALVVTVVRSHLLRLGRPGRHLFLELALTGAGLLAVRALGAPTPIGAALATWVFFLIQSLAFVLGRPEPRSRRAGRSRSRDGDPFERAREAALEMMGEPR